MATLNSLTVNGTASATEAAGSAYDLVRLREAEAMIEAALSPYAHAAVTVESSQSITLSLTGQKIKATAKLAETATATTALLVSTANGLAVKIGTGGAAAYAHDHGLATESSAGFLSAAGFAKLATVAESATANQADSYLLDRSNHEGTQGWGTIYDFAEGVAAVAVSTAGGTFTGLVQFSGEGRIKLPSFTDEELAELTPVTGELWFNVTQSRAELWDGSEAKPWPTSTVSGASFSSVYGDLTIAASGLATLGNGVVEMANLASIQTGRFLGRTASGIGAPELLTAAQMRAGLNVADGATANQTDDYLLDRGNHTGYVYAEHVYDFGAAVAAIALGPAGGTLSGPIRFTGSGHYGIRLHNLTTAEADALAMTASDKGVLIYNTTANRPQIQTPSGRVNLLIAGDGGDFLLKDGSVAATGDRQEFKRINLTDPVEATISGGTLTVPQGFFRIDTEGNAATDDIVNIYNLAVGDQFLAAPENLARSFVVKHGVGNVRCAGGADLEIDASAYDLLAGAYDHEGYVRVWKYGVVPAEGGGASLPVTDTTAVSSDPTDSTKRVRLDAGAVGAGVTAAIQAPNGDSRVRDVLSFEFTSTTWSIGTVGWKNWPANFHVESVMVSGGSAASIGNNPVVRLVVDGNVKATVDVTVSGYNNTRYGTLTTNFDITTGQFAQVEVTDNGAASSGTAPTIGVIELVGYWKLV